MPATNEKPPPTAPPSDAWIPTEPGDELTGTVVDVDTAWNKFRAAKAPNDPDAGFYPLLTIADDNGEVHKVHGFRTVLYNELVRKQPEVGERVTITFVKVTEGRDGMNGAHVYRVTVDGRGPVGGSYAGLKRAAGPTGGAIEAGSDIPSDMPGDEPLPY